MDTLITWKTNSVEKFTPYWFYLTDSSLQSKKNITND